MRCSWSKAVMRPPSTPSGSTRCRLAAPGRVDVADPHRAPAAHRVAQQRDRRRGVHRGQRRGLPGALPPLLALHRVLVPGPHRLHGRAPAARLPGRGVRPATGRGVGRGPERSAVGRRSTSSPSGPSAAGATPISRSAARTSSGSAAAASTVGASRRSPQPGAAPVGDELGEQRRVLGAQVGPGRADPDPAVAAGDVADEVLQRLRDRGRGGQVREEGEQPRRRSGRRPGRAAPRSRRSGTRSRRRGSRRRGERLQLAAPGAGSSGPGADRGQVGLQQHLAHRVGAAAAASARGRGGRRRPAGPRPAGDSAPAPGTPSHDASRALQPTRSSRSSSPGAGLPAQPRRQRPGGRGLVPGPARRARPGTARRTTGAEARSRSGPRALRGGVLGVAGADQVAGTRVRAQPAARQRGPSAAAGRPRTHVS